MNRVVFFFAFLLALFFGATSSRLARADNTPSQTPTPNEAVETAPRDTPLILEPRSVKIPALANDMTSRHHEWLDLAYPKSIDSRAQSLLELSDAFKIELGSWFGQNVLDRLEVRLARTQEDMNALAPVGYPPPRYAVGVAYPALHLILISLREPKTAEATDLDEVLRHELVHVALWDATQGHHVPLWFNEGLAVYASGESSFLRTRTLWDATLSKTVLPLDELDRGFPQENQQVSIAYAESADFVRFLLRDEDRARFGSLIERVRKGAVFDRALSDAYGDSTRKLEYQWREELEKRFSFWPMLTGSSMLWTLIMGVLVVAYVRRRKKAKETLAQWAREEAEEDRLRAEVVTEKETDALLVRRSVPTVEHDGVWHTLH